MPLVYFDASAFVKLLVEEAGSALAAILWDGCDAAVSSRLAHAEVCAALAAADRNHDLEHDAVESARRSWEEFWGSVRAVELTPRVGRLAGELAVRFSLRGGDAIHLARAVALGDPALILAAWDRRLHAGGLAAGLRVAPGRL